LKIAILNCSSGHEKLAHHGSPADLIQGWLTPHCAEAVFTQINIAGGAPFPAVDEFDGVVISGSEKGVYDECEWMQPLKDYLQTLRRQQVPVFGICFGHQIMAETWGGKAVKAEYGFVVGAREYTDGDSTYSAYAMHKDQVVTVPESATVTASTAYCPVAALRYNFPALSVQFHPEFTTPLVVEAIEAFDGDLLTADEANVSRESMKDSSVQQSLYTREAVEFFRQNVR
jgi:GMP synthase-like glutamine amidotransferase